MNSLNKSPLCVDLDGTLIATDSLWESALILLRTQPLAAFLLPLWLLRGKAYLKQQIAQRVTLPVETLPYRQVVLDFLRQEQQHGRKLVLATAANYSIASAVAKHLSLFDEVLASDADTNLLGNTKRDKLVERFGVFGYDYLGDSTSDLPVLRVAHQGFLVAPSAALRRQFECPPERIFSVAKPPLRIWLKVLRPHQWVKNVLVFLPLLLAHQLFNWGKIEEALIAFIGFSLAASAGYVLNDLLDLTADRIHPTKKRRPFAAGQVPIQSGPPLFIGLVILSISLSLAFLPLAFTGMLVLYLVLTITYSFYLKRKVILDVLVLAGLYTHRILAGGVAVQIDVSSWLLAFSMFIFMSLAFLKRYVELLQLTETKEVKNRNYSTDDMDIIASVGPTSGYLAVLVLSLYIDSEKTGALYGAPIFLWLMCPLLLYWVTRVWFLARRGQMADDPVQFALTDTISWAMVASILVLLALATFLV